MATIYLRIFSGRPDPMRVVSGAAADEFLARVQAARRSISIEAPFPLLGFRGVEVELTTEEAAQSGLPSRFWVANGRSEDEEQGIALAAEVARIHFAHDITALLHEFRKAAEEHRVKKSEAPAGEPPALPLALSPILAPYNPQKYNSNPTVMAYNNCYAYGCDLPTNTFPQPGRKHGYKIDANNFTAATVQTFSLNDGLLLATASTSNGGPLYYVALVFAPASNPYARDYHWYRQVQNTGTSGPPTFWAHKPGRGNVTNLDNSGNIITDPSTCDRGTYTQFVGYMYVPQSVVQIV